MIKKIFQVKMTDFELDQLRESVNIGASHASTALSQLIEKKVVISVPEVHIAKIDDSSQYVGDTEKVTTSVIVKILGEATGIMFFLFPDHSGYKLARLMASSADKSEMLTEEDRSALQEVGNILSGACLTALSKFLGISILHSVAEIVTDMLGSIINSLTNEIRQSSDIALIFKVNMNIDHENIVTQMFFLMDPDFTERVLKLTQKSFVR